MDQKIPGSKTFSERIKISESYEDWNGSKFLTCRIGVNLQEKLTMLKKLGFDIDESLMTPRGLKITSNFELKKFVKL